MFERVRAAAAAAVAALSIFSPQLAAAAVTIQFAQNSLQLAASLRR